jgi:hypothetical protein
VKTNRWFCAGSYGEAALARIAGHLAPDRLLATLTADEFEAPVIPSVGIV